MASPLLSVLNSGALGPFGRSLGQLVPYAQSAYKAATGPKPAVLGAATGPAPATGGQSTGGGGGGPAISLTPPVNSYAGPSADDVTSQLRAQYGQAAQDIQNQSGLLDSSYNSAKGDITNSLNDAQNATNTQKQTNDQQFGDILRNQLKTYQDLGRQRQGTFSGLGTLDSSAFQEQQFRGDQDLSNQRNQTDLQHQQSTTQIDQAFTSYKTQANSQLGQLAQQYQAGKNAIASALAQNNLQQASAISSALDQLRQRAQDVQNNVIQFANQAALLKSQGAQVQTNIGGINGTQYGNTVQQYLTQLLGQGNQQYQVPQANPTGQGYIAPNGKKYNSYQDYLTVGGLSK